MSSASPSNYQTSLSYQTEEELGESLSGWKGIYDSSSGTIVNSNDTIDSTLFQILDQLNEGEIKVPKEPQVASNAPCFSSAYNDRCVSVQTLGTDLNSASHDCPTASSMRSEKLEACLGIPSTSSIQVGDLPIDGSLVSVYANKTGTGGCAYVNRAMNGHAAGMEPRYYEPSVKNGAQVSVVLQHNGNALTNETPAQKTSEQNRSQEKYAIYHTAGEEKRYEQPSSTALFVPSDYQIPTMVSSFVPSRPQR